MLLRSQGVQHLNNGRYNYCQSDILTPNGGYEEAAAAEATPTVGGGIPEEEGGNRPKAFRFNPGIKCA